MKIFRNHNKTIVIASDRGGQCPRSILTSVNIKMGDDYHGRIKFGKKILTRIKF